MYTKSRFKLCKETMLKDFTLVTKMFQMTALSLWKGK